MLEKLLRKKKRVVKRIMEEEEEGGENIWSVIGEMLDPKQKHALFQRATLLKGQPFWVLVLFTWGSLLALNFALAFFKWVYVNFLRPAKTLKKYESWALVTELSGSIGKGFAFQLARKGINMILVSQNPDKLKDVSDSIQAKYSKTQIKIVVVAFAGELSKGVKRISEAIEGLDVGVVNL
ncbi:very-long-chain 3-oxoacyl-CoA reductase 1-like [Corylus avellana]|uniref:very-long-chain 3-oxoacyl-CoA reductase 1-like n=1 Tax=Corylus avellana TaxID=13451 RepID=UPI00286CCBC2|nr:very-long-chain 3-oxoacyl-CoA reductase 1-like [Corylus avellana]